MRSHLEAFCRATAGMTLLGVLLCLAGCESLQLGQTSEGALAGGAIGAGLGAIVGNQTGNAGTGLVVGAAAGASTGALIGNALESGADTSAAQTQRMQEQKRELDDHRALIQELRTTGTEVHQMYRGLVVNLSDVFFEPGSERLTPPAINALRGVARAIRKNGNRHISVEGHTDSLGTVAQNQRLSEGRAKNVAAVLVQNGIESRFITSAGFGESRPVAANSTEEGRRRNRRVEIVLEK